MGNRVGLNQLIYLQISTDLDLKVCQYEQEMPKSHTPTDPWHRDEETKNKYTTWQEDNKSKANRSPFLSKMIVKLERSQNTSWQNEGLIQIPHKKWEQNK